jgi:hypothetical protein
MGPRRITALAAATGVALLAVPAPAPAQAPPPELLPDLQGEIARDLSIETGPDVRNLRLTSTVANRGSGALELFPVPGTDCDGDGDPANDRLAHQRVFRDTDGSGFFDRTVDVDSTAYPAGCMVYHPAHEHWHFEDFASYELLMPGTDTVVAATSKVSFCAVDNTPLAPVLPGQPAFGYYGDCSEDAVEGISVGWSDTYSSVLAGQEIDIHGVPDGDYCLAVSGDPSGILRESDEFNNRALRPIALSGNLVTASDVLCDAHRVSSGERRVLPKAPRCAKKGKAGRGKAGKKRGKCRRGR